VGAGIGKVAVATEEGEVIVLSSEDGSELWRAKVSSEVSSAPQFNQELAVFQLINGQVVAFDAATGEHVWTFDSLVPRLTLRGTSAPVVAGDVTFAGFANGKMVAIDNVKGTALWENRIALPQGRSELERMVDIDGKPLLFENVLFMSSYQGRLVALNPFRAQIIWAQDVSSYRSLAAGFGNIYVSEAMMRCRHSISEPVPVSGVRLIWKTGKLLPLRPCPPRWLWVTMKAMFTLCRKRMVVLSPVIRSTRQV
jgi:outer membrane protein assembly factor BamB